MTYNKPSCEVLQLIAPYLDPKSIARASCVSKHWQISMIDDYLWERICREKIPSLFFLLKRHPIMSFQYLFSLAYRSSKTYKQKNLIQPRISFHELIFAIDIFFNGTPLLGLYKQGNEITQELHKDIFRVDIDIDRVAEIDKEGEIRVSWSILLESWGGIFCLMDCKENGNLIGKWEKQFSEELPSTSCCLTTTRTGIVAEVVLAFNNDSIDEKMKIVKVSMGLLNVHSWRYLTVQDSLRYLQHFLQSP